MNCGHCNGKSSALRNYISLSDYSNGKDEEAENVLSIFAALEMIFEIPILQERIQHDDATTDLNICGKCYQSLSALIKAYQEFLQIRHELSETTKIFRKIDKIRTRTTTIPSRNKETIRSQNMGISNLGEERPDNYSRNNKSERTRKSKKSLKTEILLERLEELKEIVLRSESEDEVEEVSTMEEEEEEAEIDVKIEPADFDIFEDEDAFSNLIVPSPPDHVNVNESENNSNDVEDCQSDDPDSEEDVSNYSSEDDAINSNKSLRSHQNHSHKRPRRASTSFQCPCCPEIFFSSLTFMEHVVQSHPDFIKPHTESEEPSSSKCSKAQSNIGLKCSLCSKHCVSDISILTHFRLMHCKRKEFQPPRENSTSKRRKIVDWEDFQSFSTLDEAKLFLKDKKDWKYNSKYTTADSEVLNYVCRHAATCSSKCRISVRSGSLGVKIEKTEADHDHKTVVKALGIPADVKSEIIKLVGQGTSKPKAIIFALNAAGVENVPTVLQLNNYLKVWRSKQAANQT